MLLPKPQTEHPSMSTVCPRAIITKKKKIRLKFSLNPGPFFKLPADLSRYTLLLILKKLKKFEFDF